MRTRWMPIADAPTDGTIVRVRRLFDGRTVYDGPAVWERFKTEPMKDPFTGSIYYNGTDEMAWVYPAGHPHRGYRVPEPTHFTTAASQ